MSPTTECNPGTASCPAKNDSPSAGRPVETGIASGNSDVRRGVWRFAVTLPVRVAGGGIWFYQKTISPALVVVAGPGCGCRFQPTCSHYAAEALREHGLLAGLVLTVCRLAKCAPWHPGGYDPVPSRCRPVCRAVGSAALPRSPSAG